MRLGVLTDIHGNRQAFETVLADLATRGVDQLAILGDIVGYGPDPEWCTDKVAELMAKGAIAVRGNHDDAVMRPDPAMSTNARLAIDWTRTRLSDPHKSFLSDLPLEAEVEGVHLVHASAQSPQDWIYVTRDSRATGCLRATQARIILVGHVHIPALYSADLSGIVRDHAVVAGQEVPLIRSRRWLAVIGAVGQPRDGVAKAGYGILDTVRSELTFRRVGYDVAETVARLRAAALPEALAQRLMKGA
jgi:predicted phosphodiesterase